MTNDETMAVERMCTAENGNVDVCSCDNCGIEFADKYAALAAELKEYREFVGAIMIVDVTNVGFGNWDDEESGFVFHDIADFDIIAATGTDPFDAWRKMRNIELNEVESKDA